MIIDCHVHMSLGAARGAMEDFLPSLDKAGISKVMMLSDRPGVFLYPGERPESAEARLKTLMEWACFSDRIIPLFWIDPMEEDAFEQVDRAVEAGVKGFKVICCRHYPGDDRPMRVWERIAKAGRPILFHSGILYAARPSSVYNRPAGFEPLFDVPNLRFAMAHVSWPWHDECLAVYGYWRHRRRMGTTTAELFIDTTCGTPKIYREEVLSKIYNIGYDMEDNVVFGTDCVSEYDPAKAQRVLAMDKEAFDKLGVTEEQRDKYYHKNITRFLGM